jgi:lia operon protein LiaG
MLGKTTLSRVVIVTAIVAGAALALAALIGLAAGNFQPRQFGRTGTAVDERASLPLTGIDQVTVSGVSEDVRVTEGAGDTLEVWFHGTVGAGSRDAIPRLVAENTGSTAGIRLDRKQGVAIGFFWSDLVLEVSVPKGFAGKLSVQGASSDIDVADHAYADLALSTTSGDVHVGAVDAARFAMRTTSGDLDVRAITSQHSDISSVSGDVNVKSIAGDAVVHTTSGTVKLTFASVPPRLDASSTSGDVTVRLPPDAQFLLDARAVSGDVTCRFPITIAETRTGGGKHVLSGAVGTGTGTVAVTTVSGDIRIEK